MRRLVWILLVGCYSPTYRSGTPCDTTCPGDLICIEHVCRERGFVPPDGTVHTIDGPPGDVDADGALDADDNGPSVANADQHDEDTDAHGDACDPCPHVAGTLADADGDEIGDACDPQPSIAKQVLRFFDPFTTDRPQWRHAPGATRAGETLRLVNSGYTELAVATGALRIAIGGTIESVSASSEHQFAVAFGANADQTRYHYVEFYDANGLDGGATISEAIDNAYPTLASRSYNGTMPLGVFAMRIDESVAAQQITLQATLGGQPLPPLTAGTAAAPALAAGPDIAFFVQNVDVRVHYVWVVETLP